MGPEKNYLELFDFAFIQNHIGVVLMHFVLFLLDPNLSDGVEVIPEPEGKPPTQLQIWST